MLAISEIIEPIVLAITILMIDFDRKHSGHVQYRELVRAIDHTVNSDQNVSIMRIMATSHITDTDAIGRSNFPGENSGFRIVRQNLF